MLCKERYNLMERKGKEREREGGGKEGGEREREGREEKKQQQNDITTLMIFMTHLICCYTMH